MRVKLTLRKNDSAMRSKRDAATSASVSRRVRRAKHRRRLSGMVTNRGAESPAGRPGRPAVGARQRSRLRRYLISTNAHWQAAMISDLLDRSRIICGIVRLEVRALNL